jgi:hypothetical protein
MLSPQALLAAYGAVGTATDQVTRLLCLTDHVHGNDPWRVAHFQGSVNVKADQFCQLHCFLNLQFNPIDYWQGTVLVDAKQYPLL